MEKRKGIGGSAERNRPGRVQAEEDLLEDIRYCDEVLDRDTITNEDAAKFSKMRKSNIEKLISEKHFSKIFYDEKRGRWYTQNPDNMRNKVFAKTKDGLYEKLFEKYYGEKTKTLGELFPEAEAWYAERKNSCSKTVLGL